MQIIDQSKYKDFYKDKFKNLILSKTTNLYHEIIFFKEKKKNQNFLVFENNKLLAAVPFFYEKSSDSNDLIGSYYNLCIPGPIILEDLSDKKFKKLIKLIIDEIELRSKKNNLKKIKINFSDTIDIKIGTQKYFILNEYLSNLNFSNVSFMGSRLDLKKDIDGITKNFSKGHKSEIKKQFSKKYIFINHNKKKIEYKEFFSFLNNSERNNHDCKMLYELYKENKIYIVFSKIEKKEFFCSLFIITGNTVEYFFSKSLSNQHSLIVAGINFFKKFNYLEFMNLGVINSLNDFDWYSEKKKNIALFKKGFGGEKFQYTFFEKLF